MMKKILLIISFIAFVNSLSFAQKDSLLQNGIWRTWKIHIPSSIGQNEKVPLLIGFHGGGAAESTIGEISRFNQKADSAHFIAVYPEGYESTPGNRFWNAGICCGDKTINDVGFINTLIDSLIRRFPIIDSSRIYLIGASNGGMMTYRLAIELGHRIAAIASVIGNCVISGNPETNIPICHISSYLDKHVPFFGGQSDGLLYYPNQDSLLNSWAEKYGCEGGKIVLHDDSSDYKHYYYAGCKNDSRIEVYLTYNGGHTYPAPWNPKSNSINSTDIIWNFLSNYRKSFDKEPSRFELIFHKDLFPEADDKNGQSLAGTECNNIIAHNGKVWAANSNMNPPKEIEAKIIVKSDPQSQWMVDHSFGSAYARVGMLKSISFTTDYRGNTLPEPKSVLIAGLGQWQFQKFTDVRIATRNDSTGEWIVSILTHDITRPDSGNDANEIRAIHSHVDKKTGIHYVFVGANTGAVFRGAYNPKEPGLIAWDTIPEIDDLYGRVQCMAEANGVLYMGIHVKKDFPFADRGPFYRRIDGINPKWELIKIPEWLDPKDSTKTTRVSGMRGLTSILYPDGSGREFLLCYQSDPPIIERIEPELNFKVTTELNVRSFFEKEWGGKLGSYVVAAYNDMTLVKHPFTGENITLIGTWLPHPDGETTDISKSSWYLVRSENGEYTYNRIFDQYDPLSKRKYGLRATRAICPSPFPGEKNVFYVGGFDQTGSAWGNTIWIYKGVLTTIPSGINETLLSTSLIIYPNPTNTTLFIKTENIALHQYQITNSIGQVLQNGKLTGNNIDVSRLPKGIYFIQLKDEKGQLFLSKFIKE